MVLSAGLEATALRQAGCPPPPWERDLQVASRCGRRRRVISIWTVKRRERRAPLTGCAARNYFTFSTTSILMGSLVLISSKPSWSCMAFLSKVRLVAEPCIAETDCCRFHSKTMSKKLVSPVWSMIGLPISFSKNEVNDESGCVLISTNRDGSYLPWVMDFGQGLTFNLLAPASPNRSNSTLVSIVSTLPTNPNCFLISA